MTRTASPFDILKGKARRRARKGAQRRMEDARALSNTFGFWNLCCEARCRRARTCCTDAPDICFSDHSELFSAEQKIWSDRVLLARRMGCGWPRARDAGRDAVVQHRLVLARWMSESDA